MVVIVVPGVLLAWLYSSVNCHEG